MKSFLTFLLIAIALVNLGCKKFVAIEGSPLQVESSKVFADENTATSAMLGIYNQATNTGLSFFTGGNTLYPGLSADELFISGSNPNAEQFYFNKILSNNTLLGAFWNIPYKFIYHGNLIVEGLEKSHNLDPDFKLNLSAEARFVRAFCYLYLVSHFGDVPLILTTDYRTTMVESRTPVAEIYEAIEEDLLFAKSNLSTQYPSTQRARPNKFAAIAILARTYLYQKKWSEAETEATAVINSGLYPLLSDLNQVFLIGSAESIWCLARDNGNTNEGTSFIPSSSTVKPTYSFSDTLLKSFEAGDKRKVSWMKANVVSGVSYFYPYKYKVRVNTPITEQVVIMRAAELYLVRAEARLEQGKIDSARMDLNRIRSRAGLAPLVSTDPQEIRKALEKERQTELFAEWGHRWMDLKRTNRAVSHLSQIKPTFQSYSQLYPIPSNEIQRNVFLVQNPGY